MSKTSMPTPIGNESQRSGLAAALRDNIDAGGTSPAVEQRGHWYSWQLLGNAVTALEPVLQQAALPSGAPVAVICRNRPHHVAALIGIVAADCCAVPVSPFSAHEKVQSDILDTGSAFILASRKDCVEFGLEDFCARNAISVLWFDENDDDSFTVTVAESGVGVSADSGTPVPDCAILIQSSGTTGKPKRIPIRASKLLAAYASLPPRRDTGSAPRAPKPALITQPLVHIGGVFWVFHSLLERRPICLLEKFEVDEWARVVKDNNIRICSLVPAMVKMVLDSSLPRETIASLLCIRTGTAPLPGPVQQAFEERFDIPLLPTYGATEFAGAVCGWTLELKAEFGDSKRGSVGRVFAGIELRICSRESGEVLSNNEEGVLQIRGKQLDDPTCWVATTDLALIDDDGFVWIRGRLDAAINRGGFKILPHEVAALLEQHEAVREALVFAMADERLGEVPVAIMELRDGAEPVSPEEFRSWCKQRMASYFVPTTIRFVERLPRTPSMKVSIPESKRMMGL